MANRGNTIKDYFLNYEAMNNDFSICLAQTSHIRYHTVHTEQGFGVPWRTPIWRFGMLDLNRDDRVDSFIEKPRSDG